MLTETILSINDDESTSLLANKPTNKSNIKEKSKLVFLSAGALFNAAALALDLGAKTTSGITSIAGKVLKFTSNLIPSKKPVIKGIVEIASGSCVIAGIVYNFIISKSPDNVTTTVPPFITSTQTTPGSYTNPIPTGYGLLLDNQFHEGNIIIDNGNIYHFYPVIVAAVSTVLIGVLRIGSTANLLSDSNFEKVVVVLKGSNFTSWGIAGGFNIANEKILSGGLKLAGSLFNLGEVFKPVDLKHNLSITILIEGENGDSNFSFTRNGQLTEDDNKLILEKVNDNKFRKITIKVQKSGESSYNDNTSYDTHVEKANIISKLKPLSDIKGGKILWDEEQRIINASDAGTTNNIGSRVSMNNI